MNAEALLWSLLWGLLTAGLLALPFYPAWAEWRRPRDREAWPLPPEIEHGCAPSTSAQPAAQGRTLQLAPGARFQQLQAQTLVLGATPPGPADPPTQEPALNALPCWQAPPEARAWGERGWHIAHGLQIPAGHQVPGSLVVRGALQIEGPCLIDGDLKASGPLRLGAGCQVRGHVFGETDIELGPGCRIGGVVLAEGRLQLSPNVVIGSPAQTASVAAERIDVQGPAWVHGSVQARQHGRIAPAASPAASSVRPSAPIPSTSQPLKDTA